MLNSMIMSILYKATPDEVRMILVDPKRLEMGLYEGIPHLLTPVITDAKKATNALRNAVLEMERRLKLLAGQGVRNIDQYNRKMRQLQNEPRSLFDEEEPMTRGGSTPASLHFDFDRRVGGSDDGGARQRGRSGHSPGANGARRGHAPGVGDAAAQRGRNHRIDQSEFSFAHQLPRGHARGFAHRAGRDGRRASVGKGDMLFLPPGSSRLIRVHGAFVTEAETNRVVEFWKNQARPDYDQTFLLAPPAEEGEEAEAAEFEGADDPAYTDAVRVVLEMGKASTSTLQRRLRLGYGRAARILDMMQREGIIGPPDGSKPREVLKRPDWLEEVENQLR